MQPTFSGQEQAVKGSWGPETPKVCDEAGLFAHGQHLRCGSEAAAGPTDHGDPTFLAGELERMGEGS